MTHALLAAVKAFLLAHKLLRVRLAVPGRPEAPAGGPQPPQEQPLVLGPGPGVPEGLEGGLELAEELGCQGGCDGWV